MRLEGVALILAFLLMIGYGLIVDVGVIARLFRHRAAVLVGLILASAVAFLILSLAASSTERAGFFKLLSGGSGLVILVVTAAVFLPFVFVAPVAQYMALRDGGRWPAWVAAWIGLQFALLPAFVTLAFTDYYFWQQEYAAAQAEGREAKAGELGALLERAEQRHERIWGTGWTYPSRAKPLQGATDHSGWIIGLALGIDASAPIAANAPLGTPDRAALLALMQRHFVGFAVPNIRAKLVWDALEPGRFATQLAPNGVSDPGAVNEEVIPVLLERLEKHADARLCPGGRMMDDDRAVLRALVLEKGRVWSVPAQAYEMRQPWDGYPKRVEQLCR